METQNLKIRSGFGLNTEYGQIEVMSRNKDDHDKAKDFTLVPINRLKEGSLTGTFEKFAPVSKGSVINGGELAKLPASMTEDYRNREFSVDGGVTWVSPTEYIPTATRGDLRKNPVRRAVLETTVSNSRFGSTHAVTVRVTLGGPDDRGDRDVLTISANLTGATGRRAKAEVESDDDF